MPFVSTRLQQNREVVLTAAKTSGWAIHNFAPAFLEDPEVAMTAAITAWQVLEILRRNTRIITSVPRDLTSPSAPFCNNGFPEQFLGIRPPRHISDSNPVSFPSGLGYGRSSTQTKYVLEWYPNAISTFSELLIKGEAPSNLLLKIAESRREFANANYSAKTDFGILRPEEGFLRTRIFFESYGRLYTESFLRLLFTLPSDLSIQDKWISLGSRCYDNLYALVTNAIENDKSLNTFNEALKRKKDCSLYIHLSTMKNYNILIIKEIIPGDSEPSALTCIGIAEQNEAHSICVEHPIPCIKHTSFLPKEKKQKVLEHIDQVVQELRTHPSSPDIILKRLAEIHWWLAQLSLFQRGSASISEVFIQAIATSLGYKQSQWALNVLPDLEALPRPLEAFVAIYPMMFSLES